MSALTDLEAQVRKVPANYQAYRLALAFANAEIVRLNDENTALKARLEQLEQGEPDSDTTQRIREFTQSLEINDLTLGPEGITP